MANPNRPELVLELEGERIPAEKFLSAAKSFFALLNEVASEIAGRNHPVRWAVSAESGSVIIAAHPYGYQANVPINRIMAAVNSGLGKLERKANRPKDFTDKALAHARDLAQVVDGRSVTKTAIQLRGTKKKTKEIAFKNIHIHVDELLGSPILDYGTIEGRLETISLHGKPHFVVYDLLNNQRIVCDIAEDRLDLAWEIMRSRRRAAITGLIHYRKTGIPTRIEVQEIDKLSSKDIDAREVYGILTEATPL